MKKAEVMGMVVAKGITPPSPRALEVHVERQRGRESMTVTDRDTGTVMRFPIISEIKDMLKDVVTRR